MIIKVNIDYRNLVTTQLYSKKVFLNLKAKVESRNTIAKTGD